MFLGLLFPPCERDTVVGCVYTCDAATDCDSLMAGRVISQIRWWLYAVVGTQVAVGPATGSTVGPSTTLCRLVGCFALLRLLAFPRFPLPFRSFPQEEGWNFATRTTCACATPLCMSLLVKNKTTHLTDPCCCFVHGRGRLVKRQSGRLTRRVPLGNASHLDPHSRAIVLVLWWYRYR